MKTEFAPREWKSRAGRIASIEIDHECSDPDDCHVFVCRDNAGCSCGHYCCQAVGGGDDNRCAKCWQQFEKNAQRLLLEHLSTRAWAREDTMCIHFGCYDRNRVVEDALFEMVCDGYVERFGSQERPLKYRITEVGRQWLGLLTKMRAA